MEIGETIVSEKLKKVWDAIKSWIPALGLLIYQWLLVKINRKNLELRDKDLKHDLQENEHEADLDDRSSRDVIRDAINRGKNNSGRNNSGNAGE